MKGKPRNQKHKNIFAIMLSFLLSVTMWLKSLRTLPMWRRVDQLGLRDSPRNCVLMITSQVSTHWRCCLCCIRNSQPRACIDVHGHFAATFLQGKLCKSYGNIMEYNGIYIHIITWPPPKGGSSSKQKGELDSWILRWLCGDVLTSQFAGWDRRVAADVGCKYRCSIHPL